MNDKLYAVRFTSVVEVTYMVSAASEDEAMEFSPPEWPDPGVDSRWSLSYGEFQPLDGKYGVEPVADRKSSTHVWAA